MKALVYAQPGQMELQERPMPELVDGEVVLKIEAVGICGSDLHAWHGHDPRRQPGLVLGHEFVGRIERSAAPGFEPGSRWTGRRPCSCGQPTEVRITKQSKTSKFTGPAGFPPTAQCTRRR